MKSVYALIPAALLAGTVLSAPVEAKRTEDPTVHAERLSSKQKYFKTRLAKKPAKTNQAGELKARRTKPVGEIGKTAGETRKTVSETRKTASLKPRKLKLATAKKRKSITVAVAKPATVAVPRPVTVAALQPIAVAAPKQVEIKPRKVARFASLSMTKVLRSGPREAKKLDGVKALVSVQAVEVNDERVIATIRQMAPTYGVPTWFALRIANVESGYNPYARGRAGEIGIYQLKCQTARGMGFEGDCSALTDVRTNVNWGLKHLSLAIASSGGNLQLAASKHNAGLGRKSLVHSYIAKVF
jgi:soluble lytic murein transglycosylase-like protein